MSPVRLSETLLEAIRAFITSKSFKIKQVAE